MWFPGHSISLQPSAGCVLATTQAALCRSWMSLLVLQVLEECRERRSAISSGRLDLEHRIGQIGRLARMERVVLDRVTRVGLWMPIRQEQLRKIGRASCRERV